MKKFTLIAFFIIAYTVLFSQNDIIVNKTRYLEVQDY